MKKILIYMLLITPLSIITFGSLPVRAESSATKNVRSGYTASGGTSQDKLTGSGGPIETVINTMLFIAGILSVIMIIWSGIRYVTAHGDKNQVESAKSTLIYAIVGLVITIIANAIVNFVIGVFKK